MGGSCSPVASWQKNLKSCVFFARVPHSFVGSCSLLPGFIGGESFSLGANSKASVLLWHWRRRDGFFFWVKIVLEIQHLQDIGKSPTALSSLHARPTGRSIDLWHCWSGGHRATPNYRVRWSFLLNWLLLLLLLHFGHDIEDSPRGLPSRSLRPLDCWW